MRLHIDADTPGVALLGAERCAAPCDREIDGRRGARFFFRGPDIPDSDRVDLSPLAGPVTARVRGGTAAMRPAGFVLLGLGVYGLASAIESVIVGAVLSSYPDTRRDADLWYVSGGVAAGIGAGLVGLGAWLAWRGGTTVELVPAPLPSR